MVFLKEEYAKNNGRIAQTHYNHNINLFSINQKDGTCLIVDKGFNVKGEILTEPLVRAMNPDESIFKYPGFIAMKD